MIATIEWLVEAVLTLITTVAIDGAFPICYHFVLMTLAAAGLEQCSPHHCGLWKLISEVEFVGKSRPMLQRTAPRFVDLGIRKGHPVEAI